jgi:hypothetical protein
LDSGTPEGETVVPRDTAKPAPDETRLSTVKGRLLATMIAGKFDKAEKRLAAICGNPHSLHARDGQRE